MVIKENMRKGRNGNMIKKGNKGGYAKGEIEKYKNGGKRVDEEKEENNGQYAKGGGEERGKEKR